MTEPAEGDPFNPTWVARLVYSHRSRLLSYAVKRGLDAQDALDAVQDSFVSFLGLPAAQRLPRNGDAALKFLTVILRHNVQNQRRKRLRSEGRPHSLDELRDDEAEDGEVSAERRQKLTAVNDCIARMSEQQRRVMVLSLFEEQPLEVVADALGVSHANVRVLLHRARKHVRHCSSFRSESS